jgi:hypothetical protein
MDILKVKMVKGNDSETKTIGEFLKTLLIKVIEEEESFNGKRPFGSSGWSYEYVSALVAAGLVEGEIDEDGYLDGADYDAAQKILIKAIKNVFK